MKPKKKMFAALFAGLPLLVKAGVELVIGIIVLIVGGIIIYELYSVMKEVLPPANPQPTNNVSLNFPYRSVIQVEWQDTNGQPLSNSLTYVGYGTHYQYPYYTGSAIHSSDIHSSDIGNPVQTFSFQYGLDATNKPWVSMPNNVSIGNPGYTGDTAYTFQTLSDTSSNYTVAFSVNGATLIYSATTNDSSGDGSFNDSMSLDLTGTNFVTTNDADGDTMTAIISPTNEVVIESSGDLVTWTPIFTNFITSGTIQTFTDSDPMSPILKPHDITPPGNGGTVSVLSLKFYRLACYTNWP